MYWQINYSRADFLMSEDTLYFSELTFAPNAGRTVIQPLSWDFRLGEMWQQRIVGATGNIEVGETLAAISFNKKK
ncbi:ATP-grasp fold amidoligase family protein [Providencia stuartii]